MSARLKVLIVGAGMAGLTLSIALADAGHEVELVDLREDWAIGGWGLSLTGPSLRALRTLGLAERCVAEGYGIDKITNCTSDGTVVRVIEPPSISGPGLPAQAGIFRPVLHRIFRERASELDVPMRLATTVERLVQDADGVEVGFTTGRTERYDLVVGADGLRSRVRGLIGVEESPRYTEQIVWRALVERPEWGTSLHTFAGPVHNAGLIPISGEHGYVFLTENGAPYERDVREDAAAMMRAHLSAFTGPLAEVRERIVDPASIVRRPVEVILVPRPWHRGRVVLIGDAAHAPSPQLVSGAAIAIEDAVVLSQLLSVGDGVREEVPDALATFSLRRFERCRMVVESSVQIGAWEREGRHADVHDLQQRTFGALAAAI